MVILRGKLKSLGCVEGDWVVLGSEDTDESTLGVPDRGGLGPSERVIKLLS